MEVNRWIVRRAQPPDAKEMKACVQAAYQHYIARIGKPPGPMLDDYSEVIKRHQAFVATENKRIIGVLILILKNDGILMDNVAVLPEFQGKGLGHQLIQFAETQAFEQGFEYLDTYTNEVMIENIEMYSRLHYQETKRCQVAGYDRVYMRKKVEKEENLDRVNYPDIQP